MMGSMKHLLILPVLFFSMTCSNSSGFRPTCDTEGVGLKHVVKGTADTHGTEYHISISVDGTAMEAIADTGERRSADGAFLGGQVGANYQFASNWVIGAEIDGAFPSVKNAFIRPDPLVPHVIIADETKADAVASARLRLGYALGRVLIYGTGGLALGHGTLTIANPGAIPTAPAVIASESHWHVGWAAGGGLEAALDRNWTARVEYLHNSLGNETYSIAGTAVRLEGSTVRVGLNLLFH